MAQGWRISPMGYSLGQRYLLKECFVGNVPPTPTLVLVPIPVQALWHRRRQRQWQRTSKSVCKTEIPIIKLKCFTDWDWWCIFEITQGSKKNLRPQKMLRNRIDEFFSFFFYQNVQKFINFISYLLCQILFVMKMYFSPILDSCWPSKCSVSKKLKAKTKLTWCN